MTTTISNRETVNNNVNVTKLLLVCGVVAGPLFIGLTLIQAFTRQGFDLTRHAVSLLLLGAQGWIQFINFFLTGLLAVAYAAGIWRQLHPGRGGTWGPLLVGLYGAGFIVAGFFPPDPEFGFPAGAPAGMPSTPSGHAMLHSLAFFILVIAVVAASFVFARRFASLQQRGWEAYCLATGVSAPLLLVVGIAMTPSGKSGLPLLGVAVVTSAWVAIVARRLLAERNMEN